MTPTISTSWISNSGSEDSEKGGDGTSAFTRWKKNKKVMAIVFRGSNTHSEIISRRDALAIRF